MRHAGLALASLLYLGVADPAQALAQGLPPPPPQLTPPPTAPATLSGPGPGEFGGPGVTVITGDAELNLQSTGYSEGDASHFGVRVILAADRFVVPNVSVGLEVGYTSASEDSGQMGTRSLESSSILGGARGGYNVKLSDRFSAWPRLAFIFERYSTNFTGRDQTSNYTSLALFAPALFHVTYHFFIGAGPYASAHMTGPGRKARTIGLLSEVGGWF